MTSLLSFDDLSIKKKMTGELPDFMVFLSACDDVYATLVRAVAPGESMPDEEIERQGVLVSFIERFHGRHAWAMINNKTAKLTSRVDPETYMHPFVMSYICLCLAYEAQGGPVRPARPVTWDPREEISSHTFAYHCEASMDDIRASEHRIFTHYAKHSAKDDTRALVTGAVYSAWARFFFELREDCTECKTVDTWPISPIDERGRLLASCMVRTNESRIQESHCDALLNGMVGIHMPLYTGERWLVGNLDARGYDQPRFIPNAVPPEQYALLTERAGNPLWWKDNSHEQTTGKKTKVAIDEKQTEVLITRMIGTEEALDHVHMLTLFGVFLERECLKPTNWMKVHVIQWWQWGRMGSMALLYRKRMPNGERRRPVILHVANKQFWVHHFGLGNSSARLYIAHAPLHALLVWCSIVCTEFDGKLADQAILPESLLNAFGKRKQCKATAQPSSELDIPRLL